MTRSGYHSWKLAWLATLAACAVALGCSAGGSVRGAISAAGVVRSCPEVANLVLQEASTWSASLNIEAGDAATLKAGLNASRAIEQHAAGLADELKTECSGLASALGTPISAESGPEACQRASLVLAQEKAKLGPQSKVLAKVVNECSRGCASPCDAGAPAGPCATSAVSIEVVDAIDADSAARYANALQKYLPSILATVHAERDGRALISNARTSVELGIMTGRAVSEGDIVSAASAAICVLPPLLAAKRNIAALREDFRLIARIAEIGGIAVPRELPPEAPLALHTIVGRGAPPLVPPPLTDRVLQLFSFPDGGFAAQTRDGIVELPGGQLLLATGANRGAGFSISIGGGGSQLQCAVGSGHRAACLRVEPIFRDSKFVGSKLELLDSAAGTQLIGRVGEHSSLFADGIAFNAAGQLLFAYSQIDQSNNRTVEHSYVVRGGQPLSLPFMPQHGALEELGAGGRADPPLRFFEYGGETQLLYRSGRTLLLSPLDRPNAVFQVAARSSYDSRPVVGGDGLLYIFYYEPKSRTARVAVSNNGQTFRDSTLDSRESGWQLEAIPSADGAIAVYYYFRNSYNKGLRGVALHNGQAVRPPISIMREDRWNAGWHPHLVSAASGGVWLTYQSNVETETRVWSHFDAPVNLFDYAMKDPDTWEDQYKSWFLQAGAGVWYTFWNLTSKARSGSTVDGVHLHDATYHVDPTLLFSASLEARFIGLDIGVTYAQNVIDHAAKKADGATGILSGQVKIDDLLPGHDVKVEGLWGRYHGRATRDNDAGLADQAKLDTNYVDIHLFALNQWRIKYGVTFTKYSVPTPVQAYYALPTETHYRFATSALRDVHYNDIDLAAGYSKLDYLAKYENHYFGPMVDGTIAGGVTLASFDAIATPGGDVTSGFDVHLRAGLQLGWLWMQRFRGLAGLGLYVRPTYALEGGLTGLLGRPGDRDEKKADKADTESRFSLLSLRHGPWLDAGLVW